MRKIIGRVRAVGARTTLSRTESLMLTRTPVDQLSISTPASAVSSTTASAISTLPLNPISAGYRWEVKATPPPSR